ncbi:MULTISPECIES: rRNA maturation RNase YbeY [Mesonia]|uniref:Endoribonuclease YbeY n=1 Tax=Mesonia oceanica TaxID=2687242 RepID=A0AC61Y602_9FLAO|nr:MULTISPECIES: rRNA maturation RNase YbeY [Mesonia]MAN28549.1 rRNA maturation RNase YbeY [Mesonia sp.]MAQ41231.1 rRNA maturation RNase YbeY [Mesonia sp.]MBJ97329.1 rRNA maturation RNase YbeY [Flavobacteriaceae bacterium]VVU98804.1 Endoribonuclease YbeY [Mesonia oceanica]|tara:strand:+ start:44143 stop:44562 length:420 start_codon:yes stop_codon:yes gene_type:complete
MINFFSENNFELEQKENYENWLRNVLISEEKKEGEINYIFCDDDYLHEINVKYLNHDDYTDIISFDNAVGNILHGDIFISTERVAENAEKFEVSFDEELKRVIAHGMLHFCGYKDKTDDDAQLMRKKEDEKIKMFHVEQ